MLAHHRLKKNPHAKETVMNWNQIESNWKIFKVKAKLQWNELTESQLEAIVGQREGLLDILQKTYKISKHAAEWQLSGWQLRQHDSALPA